MSRSVTVEEECAQELNNGAACVHNKLTKKEIHTADLQPTNVMSLAGEQSCRTKYFNVRYCSNIHHW